MVWLPRTLPGSSHRHSRSLHRGLPQRNISLDLGFFRKREMKDGASGPCVSREVCRACFFVGRKSVPHGAIALPSRGARSRRRPRERRPLGCAPHGLCGLFPARATCKLIPLRMPLSLHVLARVTHAWVCTAQQTPKVSWTFWQGRARADTGGRGPEAGAGADPPGSLRSQRSGLALLGTLHAPSKRCANHLACRDSADVIWPTVIATGPVAAHVPSA